MITNLCPYCRAFYAYLNWDSTCPTCGKLVEHPDITTSDSSNPYPYKKSTAKKVTKKSYTSVIDKLTADNLELENRIEVLENTIEQIKDYLYGLIPEELWEECFEEEKDDR